MTVRPGSQPYPLMASHSSRLQLDKQLDELTTLATIRSSPGILAQLVESEGDQLHTFKELRTNNVFHNIC